MVRLTTVRDRFRHSLVCWRRCLLAMREIHPRHDLLPSPLFLLRLFAHRWIRRPVTKVKCWEALLHRLVTYCGTNNDDFDFGHGRHGSFIIQKGHFQACGLHSATKRWIIQRDSRCTSTIETVHRQACGTEPQEGPRTWARYTSSDHRGIG